MLQALHRFVSTGIPIYGMNRGTVGFLMNDYAADGLAERLAAAELTTIHPLAMTAVDETGKTHRAIAFNEVSLLRQRHQAEHRTTVVVLDDVRPGVDRQRPVVPLQIEGADVILVGRDGVVEDRFQ